MSFFAHRKCPACKQGDLVIEQLYRSSTKEPYKCPACGASMTVYPMHELSDNVMIYIFGLLALVLFFMGYVVLSIIVFALGWLAGCLQDKLWPIKVIK